MSPEKLKNILEAAMFAAQRPLAVDDLAALFDGSDWVPGRKAIREALAMLTEEWQERGIELVEVSSGFRFQVRNYIPVNHIGQHLELDVIIPVEKIALEPPVSRSAR